MIKSSRYTTGLNGAQDSVNSVYNVPDIDPAYAKGNLHYSNVDKDAVQFHTMSTFYDPNRPVTDTNNPDIGTNKNDEETGSKDSRSLGSRLLFDPWGFFGNDGEEADEKPIDNAAIDQDDKFAITVIGLIFAGFVAVRVFK